MILSTTFVSTKVFTANSVGNLIPSASDKFTSDDLLAASSFKVKASKTAFWVGAEEVTPLLILSTTFVSTKVFTANSVGNLIPSASDKFTSDDLLAASSFKVKASKTAF